MKKLEIIIRPDKLEVLKTILNNHIVGGITVTSVMGCGKQKGALTNRALKGLKIAGMNLLPKIQVVIVVNDEVVNEILNTIHEKVSSGKAGDGKVFVIPIDDAMRIRSGERGINAL